MYSTKTPAEICAKMHSLLENSPEFRGPWDERFKSEVKFKNGLHLFYQKGETSSHSPNGRIVRVGNHPHSQDGLIKRLKNHYSGNKNGSVFRLLIGGAILRRSRSSDPCLEHWEKHGAKTCEKCEHIEDDVTKLLRSDFSFRCIEVGDRSERNSQERRLIAALSLCPVCRPSEKWLGHFAYSEVVRSSGLWNSEYAVDKNLLTETWLEQLSKKLLKAF